MNTPAPTAEQYERQADLNAALASFYLPDGLDWRWENAKILCSLGGKLRRGCDTWVRRAVKYLDGKFQPDIDEALDIWEGSEDLKNLIQLVLMCDDLAMIDAADYVGIPLTVLDAYENLFCNVAPYRGNSTFLIAKTVPAKDCAEPWDTSRPSFRKRLAACQGFRLLRPILEPEYMTAELQAELDEIKRTHDARDKAFNAYFRPLNEETYQELVIEWLLQQESPSVRERNVKENKPLLQRLLELNRVLSNIREVEQSPEEVARLVVLVQLVEELRDAM
jgi:hypothetical protein